MRHHIATAICMLGGMLLSACGPTQAELAETATQAAADLAATQIAAAPTATPTFSPTATHTPTLTPTPSPTFTLTFTPTSTPTATATPTDTPIPRPTGTPIPKPTIAPTNTTPPSIPSSGGGVPTILGVLSQVIGDPYSLTLAVLLDGLTPRAAPVSPQDTAGITYTVVAYSPDDCQAVNCGPFGLGGKFHSQLLNLFVVPSSTLTITIQVGIDNIYCSGGPLTTNNIIVDLYQRMMGQLIDRSQLVDTATFALSHTWCS